VSFFPIRSHLLIYFSGGGPTPPEVIRFTSSSFSFFPCKNRGFCQAVIFLVIPFDSYVQNVITSIGFDFFVVFLPPQSPFDCIFRFGLAYHKAGVLFQHALHLFPPLSRFFSPFLIANTLHRIEAISFIFSSSSFSLLTVDSYSHLVPILGQLRFPFLALFHPLSIKKLASLPPPNGPFSFSILRCFAFLGSTGSTFACCVRPLSSLLMCFLCSVLLVRS